MTFTDVFIGDLFEGPDPPDCGGGWDRINCKRISDNFPIGKHGGPNPFNVFHNWIRDGRISGKQVDWGAWAAVVTKADIESFVAEIYGDRYEPDATPFQRSLYDHLIHVLESLPFDHSYAVVAFES